MKNHNPAGKGLRFAQTRQRLVAMTVLATMALLVWLAWSGRYDVEINRFAEWLQRQAGHVVNSVRNLF